jgi:hypothetical protein
MRNLTFLFGLYMLMVSYCMTIVEGNTRKTDFMAAAGMVTLVSVALTKSSKNQKV